MAAFSEYISNNDGNDEERILAEKKKSATLAKQNKDWEKMAGDDNTSALASLVES